LLGNNPTVDQIGDYLQRVEKDEFGITPPDDARNEQQYASKDLIQIHPVLPAPVEHFRASIMPVGAAGSRLWPMAAQSADQTAHKAADFHAASATCRAQNDVMRSRDCSAMSKVDW
jgi:hypothetical protein